MSLLSALETRARRRNGCVVFPEGEDERILAAARRLCDERLARPVLLGDEREMEAVARRCGLDLDGLTLINPSAHGRLDIYVDRYVTARPKTRPTAAQRQLRKPLFHAGMMVRCGDADAMVAGVANPTARIIKAALMTVGLASGIGTPSSYFLMVLPDRVMLFADCAVNIDPDEDQLADIALASAESAEKILGEIPAVAMLAAQTNEGHDDPLVNRIHRAAELALGRAPKRNIVVLEPEQAFVPGSANVFVFPDLVAGNIGYKIAQYLGGAQAVGPFLQGFAHPVSDLSRGASVDDVVQTTVVLLATA